MFFEEVYEQMLADLDEPKFRLFTLRDENPVSGRMKLRKLGSPNQSMITLHRRFFSYLRSARFDDVRDKCLTHSSASKRGDRTLTNVLPHRANRFFYSLDFRNAFGNVSPKRLAEVLVNFDPRLVGEENKIETFLTRYFFSPGRGLIQGGNAAPDLFNLYAGTLVDLRLEELLNEHRITYTRYLDDLTFSSSSHITANARRHIRKIITEAGFPLGWRKCEYVDLKTRTIMVTGICIVWGGRLQVPRPFLRRVRAILHNAAKPGSTIKLAKIVGLMSPIRSSMPDGQKPNRIEQRVLEEYEVARQMCIRENRL